MNGQDLDLASTQLIDLACASIERGLDYAWSPEPPELARRAELELPGTCFVTLSTLAHGLRGCRGALEAQRSLAADVWHNAFASAFDDPRFLPVERDEFEDLTVEVSVLSELRPLEVSSEAELLAVLVPHRDGVVLGHRGRRATFLPKVWELVPSPREFVAELKQKAGLRRDFWARDVAIWTYTTEIAQGSARDYGARARGSQGIAPTLAVVDEERGVDRF